MAAITAYNSEQDQETTPLLLSNRHPTDSTTTPKEMKSRSDAIFGAATHVGLALFVGLIISVLVRIPFNVFTYHPIFIMLFIVFTTEGVNLLQTTSTAKEKAKGLKKHAFMQASAYIFAIVGFSFIVYNKAMMHKEHFTSNHGKFGLTVFCYLFFQLLFGLTIAYIPRLYGNVTKAKQLWKFHRMTGYILLVLIWITAQLGVRADYMYKNLWSPKLIIGHYIALALVVIGIAGRVRLSKWGLSSSTSPPAALPQQAEVSRN